MNAALSAGTISGFRSDTVTVDGVLLHYWVGGRPDGEPVILWHGFLSNKNNSGKTVRMLCMCTPAGQEEFFMEVGEPVAARTSPAPKLDKVAEAAFIAKVVALAPKYRTELLKP